jgi:hypothetical protein
MTKSYLLVTKQKQHLHFPQVSSGLCKRNQWAFKQEPFNHHAIPSSNPALNPAPFGRWTALKRRRLALR